MHHLPLKTFFMDVDLLFVQMEDLLSWENEEHFHWLMYITSISKKSTAYRFLNLNIRAGQHQCCLMADYSLPGADQWEDRLAKTERNTISSASIFQKTKQISF